MRLSSPSRHVASLRSTTIPRSAMVSDFAMITPDGQAVKLALNFLYRRGMRERVSGPDLLPRVCRGAAEQSVGVFMARRNDTVSGLRNALMRSLPALRLVGCDPSVFPARSDSRGEPGAGRAHQSHRAGHPIHRTGLSAAGEVCPCPPSLNPRNAGLRWRGVRLHRRHRAAGTPPDSR